MVAQSPVMVDLLVVPEWTVTEVMNEQILAVCSSHFSESSSGYDSVPSHPMLVVSLLSAQSSTRMTADDVPLT